MAEQAAVEYTPVGRYSHVAATVDSKLYVWGGWKKDTPHVHDGPEKTKLTSIVEVLDLQEMQWSVQHTNGDPPLGVSWCAYTVVGKRIIIYGGFCQHGHCYQNTLHELDTSILTWRQLAASDASGAPMRKWNCGLVAYNNSGDPEKLSVFGGYGELKQSQPHSDYIRKKNVPGNTGYISNEIHCFISTKWSSPEVAGERPPPILGFSYAKISEYEVAMFGGYAVGRINDLYILRFTDTHIHCTRVVKPEKVPWPDARSHHGSCVLASPLTGHKNTHILSTGGEGISAESLNDVWIGEYNKERTTWKQVDIPEQRLVRIKRQRHSVAVCRLDTSHVIVVIHGGVEKLVRGERIAQQQDMLADTSILEFELHNAGGNDVWVLARALDLSYYQKLSDVKLRKRVKDLEKLVPGATTTTPLSLVGPYTKPKPLYHQIAIDPCGRPLNMKVLSYCEHNGQSIAIIDELAPDWIKIGYLLSFTSSDLDSISQQYSSARDSCQRMLSKWLNGFCDKNDNRPKTWTTLLEVIKAARWGTLANEIQDIIFPEKL